MKTIQQVGMDCCGCGACAIACPKSCIRMAPNEEGFLYPETDENTCIHCSRCESVCPVLHVGEHNAEDFREAWAVTQKDSHILQASSSGGLFTALATAILETGGCVFGVGFTKDFRRVHCIMADKPEQLALLRGSKYLQSETDGGYAKVKQQLEQGRPVLFSGTPCQVAGLRQFLGREYKNLYVIDIICHGTPSALVWQHYLDHIAGKNGQKTVSVNYRHKQFGWHRYGLEVLFADGKRFFQEYTENSYMKVFLRDYCLRESCYHCVVKETGSVSDLTIGDFWGVKNVLPEVENSMGVSLALIHTEKGKQLFERTEPMVEKQRADYAAALAANPAMTRSVRRPEARSSFFHDLTEMPWRDIERKYAKDKIAIIIKRELFRSFVGVVYRKLRQR
ncbi:MAG: Coenzyme F420 hydrogenase/dehydrogenase, beta subunit C-terminal domain [Clostridia bacterium]|nr:Coenzyme F420 hydrogenase/dehydrogenase, beta subunit C-terminal domain [Clostridia bacterium]